MMQVIICSYITSTVEIISSFAPSFLGYFNFEISMWRMVSDMVNVDYIQVILHLNMTFGQDSEVGCFAYSTFHVQLSF